MSARYFMTYQNIYSVGERAPQSAGYTRWEADIAAAQVWRDQKGEVHPYIYAVNVGVISAVDRWMPTENDLIWLVEECLREGGIDE